MQHNFDTDTRFLCLVMAQLNLLVGDLQGNTDKIIASIEEALQMHNADVIVFPELAVCGYPPEDLLLRPTFIQNCRQSLDRIVEYTREVRNITVIVGVPLQFEDKFFNAASVIRSGRTIANAQKRLLPNYGVFDERRYFSAGTKTCVVEIVPGFKAGVTICEDIWGKEPAYMAVKSGASIILNLNASPFHMGKHELRHQMVVDRINETGLPVVYVNQVAGQDELIFDGASMVVDSDGQCQVQGPVFKEALIPVQMEISLSDIYSIKGMYVSIQTDEALIYDALVFGVRDYVEKNGFHGVVLGLSGGIDSALTLAIAVDALGADKVSAIMMPSRYTADMSLEDAEYEASILGVEFHIVPIASVFAAFRQMLAEVFHGQDDDVTEENLQARSRGVVLMAISNKQGKMVLTTGNKSEMAVGYATLYGDMAGGFAPLKDIYKTLVYKLAKYRNTISPVIPERVIQRAPSAELAPDQTDQDSLPPYEILDNILERYIEYHQSIEQITGSGCALDVVEEIIRRVNFNEYKRRQAPPGIKITKRAFGRDRRYPISCRYQV